eukprot:4975868-Pleurochrysis_carterae.AAC.4
MCDALLATTSATSNDLIMPYETIPDAKKAQKRQRQHVTLVERFSNVPSPSQHELQPVSSLEYYIIRC